MNQIMKHSFEAVSLLTTQNGMLEVTIIPAMNQPDWIIPSSLILSVDDYTENVWTYPWQEQEVAVFHLLPPEEPVDKMIVLEGNTVVHRFALQTKGELRQLKVRISDVKDAELPDHYVQAASNSLNSAQPTKNVNKDETNSDLVDTNISGNMEERFKENVITSYMFLTIVIDNVPYLIPDLDKIAHQLIDLDS